MKAELDFGGKCFVLKLIPENDSERKVLPDLDRRMARPHMITARGFDYMSPDVEFYVQPMPSGE